MQVRAKGDAGVVAGYYGHLRRKGGSVFELADPKEFSAKWMERTDEDHNYETAQRDDTRKPVAMSDVAKYNDDPEAARRAKESLLGPDAVTGKRKN